jgi:8-oxo-dGTP pyrophosphatase MutT (NUDIX family)
MHDAATVLLLRDRPISGFEVLLVRRHGKSGFMAGAHVFPGGKLDAADAAPALASLASGLDSAQAARLLGEPELSAQTALALFVAAARETFEEVGVLLGPQADASKLDAARAELRAGAAFADVLAARALSLQLDRVVPFSRWITPAVEPRRFDTRFFVAQVPPDQQADHDRHETTEHVWMSPAQALAATGAGSMLLPPPTLKTLLDLSGFERAEQVLDEARRRPPPRVAPVIEQVDDKLTVVLPGDPLHPEPAQALPGATRIVLENGRVWAR